MFKEGQNVVVRGYYVNVPEGDNATILFHALDLAATVVGEDGEDVIFAAEGKLYKAYHENVMPWEKVTIAYG